VLLVAGMGATAEQRAVQAIARLDHAGPETTAESRLIDAFRQLDAQKRSFLCALVLSSGQTERIATFAEQCAESALRDRRAQALEDGLVAVAMLDWRAMPRPMLRALGKLHESARRLSIDARPLFVRAAALAIPASATVIERFLQPL
jgi:hypothetical protein